MVACVFYLLLVCTTANFRPLFAQEIDSRDEAIVVTDCGPVAGIVDTNWGGFAFRGIPYAMPPIGDQRWKRSVILKDGGGCWNGTLDTRTRSDKYMDERKCMQPSKHPPGTWDGVEDCLTVDVRTPIKIPDSLSPSSLPVLFEIHGGSLTHGKPDIPYALRNENIILVGVRYRVNVLGFLALAELTANDPRKASGNYGFSDQVTALRWVRRNVQAFGGDPSQVTVFGCSSGGSSIWNLLAIPSARGLFARAIPMSAASRNNVTLAQAEVQNRVFVRSLCANSTSAARYRCLMDLTSEKLRQGYMSMTGSNFPYFNHPLDFELPSVQEYSAGVCIVDGVVVERPLQVALEKGSPSPVAVLSGSCSQEGRTSLLTPESTAQDFKRVLEAFVANLTTASWPPHAASRLLELYPPTSAEFFGSPKAAMDAMSSDIRIVCGTVFNARRLVDAHPSGATPADVWLYYADMHSTNDKAEMSHCKTFYALGTMNCTGCTPEHRAFRENLIRVTSTFIRTGSLPEKSLKRFSDTPTFAQGDYILNTIGPSITSKQSRLRERCEFWRDAKVLQYAWDELTDALGAAVAVI